MESPSEMNIENFIQEIQNRPAVWDMTTREYSDRIAKKKAWEEISSLFINDFEAKTTKEKNEESLKLQKKWKGIRDCYTRHTSKKSKSGSEVTTSRDYIYSPYLSFLNPLSKYTRPKDKIQKESQDSCPYSRKESVEDDSSEKLIRLLTTRLENQREKTNPDYNFFMSLLDDFSGINSDYKMDAKMEIMGVIKKYVQMSKCSGHNSSYSTPSPAYFASMKTSSSPAPSHHSDSTQESIY